MVAVKLVRQCCECHARWVPGRGAFGGRWVPHQGLIKNATHTYCPKCLRRLQEMLKKYQPQHVTYAAGS